MGPGSSEGFRNDCGVWNGVRQHNLRMPEQSHVSVGARKHLPLGIFGFGPALGPLLARSRSLPKWTSGPEKAPMWSPLGREFGECGRAARRGSEMIVGCGMGLGNTFGDA